MFATPTTPPPTEVPTRFKVNALESYIPKYVDPNTLEETFPTNLHAQVIVSSNK